MDNAYDYLIDMNPKDPIEPPSTQVVYTDATGQPVVVWGTPGTTAQALLQLVPDGLVGREITRVEAEALFLTLESVKVAKLSEILDGANSMAIAIKAKYSQSEVDSWTQQEAEARAVLADSSAETFLVHDLAANVGSTPEEFAVRIINAAERAAIATKYIVLQQQAMEKAVQDATSIEAVQAIIVNYTLPGV